MNDKSIEGVPKTLVTDATDSLTFKDQTNTCNVTGLPYDIPQLRSELANTLQDAISQQKAAIYVEADVDLLKKLNDKYGKGLVNEGIRGAIALKRKKINSLAKEMKIFFFRPQSGGDEYEILIIANRTDHDEIVATLKTIMDAKEEPKAESGTSSFSASNTIIKPQKTIMDQEEEPQAKAADPPPIMSSYGIKSLLFSGNEDKWQSLQTLQEEANLRLIQMKIGKLDDEIRITVGTGKKISYEEYEKYADLIAETFGSIRTGKKGLYTLLHHYGSKVFQAVWKGTPQLH